VTAALKAPRRELVRLYVTPAAAERLAAEIAARGVETRVTSAEEIAQRLPRDAVHQGALLEARPLAPILPGKRRRPRRRPPQMARHQSVPLARHPPPFQVFWALGVLGPCRRRLVCRKENVG